MPKWVFLTPDRVFWAIVRENWITGMGCSSVEEYKNKQKLKKSQYPYMLTPRGVSTAHRTRTKFGSRNRKRPITDSDKPRRTDK